MGNTRPMTSPRHAPMNQFSIEEDCLVVGGKTLPELAQELGRTPFFAYDSSVVNSRVQSLREALPSALQIHYAVKANPMPELVKHLDSITDGLDVASAGELRIALEAGAEPSCISFAGPGKSEEDLQLAIESGVVLNIESESELERAVQLGKKLGKTPYIAIRVNPDFELKTAGMKMGSGPKPFGIDAERVPALLRTLGSYPCQFMGFHIFCGSQSLQAEAIAEAQSNTFELAVRLAKDAPGPVRSLNIGGGLGVPYFPGESRVDLQIIGNNLHQLMERYASQLPDAAIVMELGRFLTAEAGVYVCEVIDRKISRGSTFLITNGGLHHHLAASGNFGQVIRKNYPLAVGNRMQNQALEEFTVAGPLCTPLDILGDKVMLPKDTGRGDLIVVFQSGAYAFSASPRDFLGHPAPMERLL
jgi:diaminopimelate decarboxylase